jgi:cyclic pyranopterin phosphate synthase
VTEFTHLDESGDARMVDIAAKGITDRRAVAEAFVRVSAEVVSLLRGAGVPKGDALAVARIAAIGGTKRTADLIPLCHPIAIHGVDVDVQVEGEGVRITVAVRTADRTGVEMEALTGASVGALAMIDMVKGVDRSAMIEQVVLLEKSGGRSGHYRRTESTESS